MKITKKLLRYLLIAAQIFLWIGLIWVIYENRRQAARMIEGVSQPLIIHIIWICIPFILLININWYCLAPRFLRNGSFMKYGILVVITILFCAFLFSLNSTFNDNNQLNLMIADPSYSSLIPSFLTSAFIFLVVYLLSMPFYLSISWFDQQSKISKLESENLRTELTSLKEQINPHFFFNTLNNLYSLTLTNSKNASKAVLKLSELMRYVIYDAKKALVMIQEEIDYIESYLEIQRIRLGEKSDIKFTYEIDDPTTSVIPLLFINLLENAFKHGSDSMLEGSQIECSLQLNNRRLTFNLKNNYEKGEESESGVGLTNLRRRLELVYPDRHQLNITDENGYYFISLVIEKIDELPDN